MGAALAVRRSEHDADELRRFAAKSGDGSQVRRLLAIALVLEGYSRTEAAELSGMDRQTLRGQLAGLKALVVQGPDPDDAPGCALAVCRSARGGRTPLLGRSPRKHDRQWCIARPDASTTSPLSPEKIPPRRRLLKNFATLVSRALLRVHGLFVSIPRSHDNPEFLWIDDPEIVGDLIAVGTPVPRDVVAQEAEHRDAEVLEGAVALVVGGMPVH